MVGLAVTAVVAIGVGVALVTGFLSPPGTPGAGPAPASVRIVGPAGIGAATYGDGELWVDDPSRGIVERLDPATGRVVGRPVHLGGSPGALAVADGRVFVADRAGGTVDCLSARNGRPIGQPLTVGSEPISVVAGYGLVWVASLGDGTVTAIDPRSPAVVTTVALPDGAVRLAVGDGAVWATGRQDLLARIDPRPRLAGLRFTTATVGDGPIGVAVGDRAVFTANLAAEDIAEVDPSTMRVVATVPFGSTPTGPAQSTTVGAGPADVAVLGQELFVASYAEPQVAVLSVRTGQPVGPAVAVPGPVTELVAGGGHVWAVTANPDRLVALTPR